MCLFLCPVLIFFSLFSAFSNLAVLCLSGFSFRCVYPIEIIGEILAFISLNNLSTTTYHTVSLTNYMNTELVYVFSISLRLCLFYFFFFFSMCSHLDSLKLANLFLVTRFIRYFIYNILFLISLISI